MSGPYFPAFGYHPTLAPKGQLFQTDPGWAAMQADGWVDTPDKFPIASVIASVVTVTEQPETWYRIDDPANPDPGDTTDPHGLVDDASVALAPPKKRGRPKKEQ